MVGRVGRVEVVEELMGRYSRDRSRRSTLDVQIGDWRKMDANA